MEGDDRPLDELKRVVQQQAGQIRQLQDELREIRVMIEQRNQR